MNGALASNSHSLQQTSPDLSCNSQHRPALDGVRGLAVLLVLSYDCLKLAPTGDPLTKLIRFGAAGGWIGVDLFFVLSGFLITGILLESKGSPGYWKSFLARRAVRIFPLYYATLLTVFVLLPGFCWMTGLWSGVHSELVAVGGDQVWYWLYLQNWLFAWRQAWPDPGLLKHFWSLAIEEQFYLVWPLVVALCTRRQLAWLCVSVGVLALWLRVMLLAEGVPGMVGFAMTITRMDSLCWGALLAIGVRTAATRQVLNRLGPMSAVLGLGLLAGADLLWGVCRSQSYAANSFGHTAIALGFVGLITGVVTIPDRHWLAKLVGNRALVVLGKYSYAIYVFHRFVYHAVTSLDWSGVPEVMRGWGIFAATLLLSLLAARVSWLLLEQPFLSLKQYFPRPEPVREENRSQVTDGKPAFNTASVSAPCRGTPG